MRLPLLAALPFLLASGCLGPPPELTGPGLLARPEPVEVGDGLRVAGRPFTVKAADEPAGGTTPERLAAMKEGGFNAVRLAAGPDPTSALDAAATLDLKVILVVDGGDARGLERSLRILLARHAHHPALLLWQIGEDWPVRGGSWAEDLERLARIARQEDPRHPVATGLGSPASATALRQHAPTVSVVAAPVTVAGGEGGWSRWSDAGPLLAVAEGVDATSGGDRLAAFWREAAARPRVVGAVAGPWDQLAASPALDTARIQWATDGHGTPPSILGLWHGREGEAVVVRTRVVTYAAQNVSVHLHFRPGTGAWQTTPMAREAESWRASLLPYDTTFLFLRIHAVDEAGRERTSAETAFRAAPAAGLAGLAAILLAAAAGRARRA